MLNLPAATVSSRGILLRSRSVRRRADAEGASRILGRVRQTEDEQRRTDISQFLVAILGAVLLGWAIAVVVTVLVRCTLWSLAPDWAEVDQARTWAVSVILGLAVLVTIPIGPIVWLIVLLTYRSRRVAIGRVSAHNDRPSLPDGEAGLRSSSMLIIFLAAACVAAVAFGIFVFSADPSAAGADFVTPVVLVLLIGLPLVVLVAYAYRRNPALKAKLTELWASVRRTTTR